MPQEFTLPSPKIDSFLFDLITALDAPRISMTAVRVFIVLSQTDRPISLRALAGRIGRDRTAVRLVVRDMAASGFVTVGPHGVTLTEAGEAERQRLIRETASSLTPRCREALALIGRSGIY